MKVTARRFANLSDARAALEEIASAGELKAIGRWSAAQVFLHCAQSVRFSMSGFPKPKLRLVQLTVGRIVAGRFLRAGEMSHDLAAPIPGAPELDLSVDTGAALRELLGEVEAFDRHSGPLAPHFVFGELPKADYGRLHAMHIANHLGEIGPAGRVS